MIPAKLSEAVARAWDAEEAHQMGEPSPWDFGYDAEWEAGRVFLADTALDALDAAGFVVVPKEPTEAMTLAGGHQVPLLHEECDCAGMKAVYVAMIAASKETT